MIVSKVNSLDINEIVNLHVRAFSSFFLTSLGEEFLEVYFGCIVNDGDTNCFKCTQDDVIIGYVFTISETSGFNKRLVLRNLFSFLLVIRKINIINLYRIFRKEFENNNELNSQKHTKKSWHILSIAASSIHRDLGVGFTLIQYVITEARLQGIEVISLTTDAQNNSKVQQFYTKHGFEVTKKFNQLGDRSMLWMELTLD